MNKNLLIKSYQTHVIKNGNDFVTVLHATTESNELWEKVIGHGPEREGWKRIDGIQNPSGYVDNTEYL